MLVAEVFEEELGYGGLRREIAGPEVIEAVV